MLLRPISIVGGAFTQKGGKTNKQTIKQTNKQTWGGGDALELQYGICINFHREKPSKRFNISSACMDLRILPTLHGPHGS